MDVDLREGYFYCEGEIPNVSGQTRYCLIYGAIINILQLKLQYFPIQNSLKEDSFVFWTNSTPPHQQEADPESEWPESCGRMIPIFAILIITWIFAQKTHNFLPFWNSRKINPLVPNCSLFHSEEMMMRTIKILYIMISNLWVASDVLFFLYLHICRITTLLQFNPSEE